MSRLDILGIIASAIRYGEKNFWDVQRKVNKDGKITKGIFLSREHEFKFSIFASLK